jgi:hypothetical protein
MDKFVPEDNEESDEAYHKLVRRKVMETLNTKEDFPFTKQEIKDILNKLNHRKAPGEDALTSEILRQTFETFPNTFTEIYNECLRRGHFPKQCKTAVIVPLIKTGKEETNDAQKYRPISLLNTGGKVLDKLLIYRINHYLFSNNLTNNNQFGFRPQRSTIDAALAVEEFALHHIKQREYVVMISLDVIGVFDVAWRPGISNNLRNLRCPSNLYNLTRSYFSDRLAIWQANTYRIERKASRGCPQGSCSGPGWQRMEKISWTEHVRN